ncbi:hypothetical protein [Methanocella sp. MCL-LM]|uniref:hypothetical protein n=1 Tax=Methanocella sp. MCL-LM TaxID=3412035 RepID=UPI003C784169
MKCKKCNTDVLEGSLFCNKCGEKVEVESQIKMSITENNGNSTDRKAQENLGKKNTSKKKLGLAVGILIPLIAFIGVIILLIISIGAYAIPIVSINESSVVPTQVPYTEYKLVPTQVPYQETVQVPAQVPYQAAVQQHVDLKFSKSASWGSGGLTDFYLEEDVIITNLDTQGGSFTATGNFYDGGVKKSTQSKSVYINPGETTTVNLRDYSFNYDSNWRTRYSADFSVTPPQKTVTSYETQYRTDYQTQVVTKYRTENQQQAVTKYQTQYNTVYTTKTITLLQYLTGNY